MVAPQVEIFGYRACQRCNDHVVMEVWVVTGGFCSSCWRELEAPLFAKVDALVERRITPIGPSEARRRANRKREDRRRDKPEHKAHRQLRWRVKYAAMRRLRALHPEDYTVLLAEERAKAGLDPWPVSLAVEGHIASEALMTLREPVTYHPDDGEPEDVEKAG